MPATIKVIHNILFRINEWLKIIYFEGMGDSKIVPNLDVDKFDAIIKLSRAFKLDADVIHNLWTKCKNPIYNLTERTKCIGLKDKGITTYFSENCTKDDSDRFTEWLQMKKICAYNSRAFKTENDGHITYEIKLASAEKGEKDGITVSPEEYKGHNFVVTRGDHASIMALIIENLTKAKEYAANDNQAQMIEHYIKSFNGGSTDEHKDGTR